MRRAFGGAVLLVAGAAALIEAHAQRSRYVYVGELRDRLEQEVEGPNPQMHLGLSPTACDLLRIGGWALVLTGALLVGAALLRRRRAPHGVA